MGTERDGLRERFSKSPVYCPGCGSVLELTDPFLEGLLSLQCSKPCTKLQPAIDFLKATSAFVEQ